MSRAVIGVRRLDTGTGEESRRSIRRSMLAYCSVLAWCNGSMRFPVDALVMPSQFSHRLCSTADLCFVRHSLPIQCWVREQPHSSTRAAPRLPLISLVPVIILLQRSSTPSAAVHFWPPPSTRPLHTVRTISSRAVALLGATEYSSLVPSRKHAVPSSRRWWTRAPFCTAHYLQRQL